MIDAYPDTSFLWSLYVSQSNSPAALSYMSQRTGPLYVTELLRYEFRQSLRFQAWRHADNPVNGITESEAKGVLENFENDIRNGVALIVPVSWQSVFIKAEELSARRTLAAGHRAFDILHVATALVLEAEQLLTFDRNQRKLGAAEGLQVAP